MSKSPVQYNHFVFKRCFLFKSIFDELNEVSTTYSRIFVSQVSYVSHVPCVSCVSHVSYVSHVSCVSYVSYVSSSVLDDLLLAYFVVGIFTPGPENMDGVTKLQTKHVN